MKLLDNYARAAGMSDEFGGATPTRERMDAIRGHPADDAGDLESRLDRLVGAGARRRHPVAVVEPACVRARRHAGRLVLPRYLRRTVVVTGLVAHAGGFRCRPKNLGRRRGDRGRPAGVGLGALLIWPAVFGAVLAVYGQLGASTDWASSTTR